MLWHYLLSIKCCFSLGLPLWVRENIDKWLQKYIYPASFSIFFAFYGKNTFRCWTLNSHTLYQPLLTFLQCFIFMSFNWWWFSLPLFMSILNELVNQWQSFSESYSSFILQRLAHNSVWVCASNMCIECTSDLCLYHLFLQLSRERWLFFVFLDSR